MSAVLRLRVCSGGGGRGGRVYSCCRLRPSMRGRGGFAAFARRSVDCAPLEQSISSDFNSAVGCSSVLRTYRCGFRGRQFDALVFLAGAAVVSAMWICFSAIPTLMAFKRAAGSMERLVDVMREEIPGTMMTARLAGMEISDLTMEFSNINLEITPRIRQSTQAMQSFDKGSLQQVPPLGTHDTEPIVARTARRVREGIIKGRAAIKLFFTLTHFSSMLLTSYTFRSKK